MIRGITVKALERRFERIAAADRRLHEFVHYLHSKVDNAIARADGHVRQAIADRQAAIRVASEEIAQLEKF